jgi:hypothetical protein
MFPNLRLIIGAAIASIALVITMGSGVLSLRDPYRTMGEVPELHRPFVQHSMVENPDWHRARSLASSRRNDELQRLRELPAGSVQADAPEPPTVYMFKVSPAPEELATPEDLAPPPDEPAPEHASQLPEADEPVTEPMAALPEAAPSPPPALPEAAADAPAPAQASEAQTAERAPPDAKETVTAVADPAPPSEPTADAPAEAAQAGAIEASPVPAIERAPLPPRDPRTGLNRAESAGSRPVPPAVNRTVRAKPRKAAQTARAGADRTIPASVAPPPFGVPPVSTPSQAELFSQRPYNMQ